MAGLFAGPLLAGRSRFASTEQVSVGVIGLGSRGFNLIDAFLRHADCRINAVCDVDELHHRDRPWGEGPRFGRIPGQQRVAAGYADAKSGTPARGLLVTADYRDIVSRDDIDAVVIATPDHWHAKIALQALEQGKDVYCEKPVTHLFREGQLICQRVAEHHAVFQTGSQQRSAFEFRRAAELVRNGLLGEIRTIEVGLPPGYDQPQGDTTVTAPPQSLDYDFWCGPSPVLPYMRARHHRWWRGHRAYGGGVLMDWIGHHNDIAHWAIGAERSGPLRVSAEDWLFPDTDVYDSPHHYTIRCDYVGGISSTISSRNRGGLRMTGTDGWLHVNRGQLQTSDPRWEFPDFDPGPVRVSVSDDHVRNFLDCVRTRDECIAPADGGHRSITPGHLGYVSQALGRPLNWNPATETVVDDAAANDLLRLMPYRDGW